MDERTILSDTKESSKLNVKHHTERLGFQSPRSKLSYGIKDTGFGEINSLFDDSRVLQLQHAIDDYFRASLETPNLIFPGCTAGGRGDVGVL